jgi:uncharacterized RDD family membrane protein YckC
MTPGTHSRRRRKAARASRIIESDQIHPPEGVPLTLPVARTGVRFSAQIVDLILTLITLIAIVIILSWLELFDDTTISAVIALLFFFIRIPYYALTELAWNGQTFGKRLLKIKVVAHDGGPLTTHAIVLRNLTKEAEVFLPATLLLTFSWLSGWLAWLAIGWIAICLLVPLRDIYARRLGDILAGTHVVHLPQPVFLPELAKSHATSEKFSPDFVFRSDQLDHYGAYELQTLETLLRVSPPILHKQRKRYANTRAIVTRKIRTKIGYAEAIPENKQEAFLRAFYAAQRKHLENKQLFGDRRADKYHAENSDDKRQ